jgi:hypothetical protein
MIELLIILLEILYVGMALSVTVLFGGIRIYKNGCIMLPYKDKSTGKIEDKGTRAIKIFFLRKGGR